MKTVIKFILIISLSIKDLFAIVGGEIVSDPTSYTYYAKQIKAFNDQIKNTLDQINILNDVNKVLNKANELIFESGEKIYNPVRQIQNLIGNLESTQRRFESMAERMKNMGVERFLKDYHNIEEPLETEAYEKWKDKIEALFDNSKDEKYKELQDEVIKAQNKKSYKDYEKAVNNLVAYLKLKKLEQEAMTKSALKAPLELYHQNFMNANVVNERKNRATTIQNLLSQVNSEKDMLKQQQTTNQILIMLLETIDKQYEMQMQYQYAMTTLKYRAESKSIEQDIKQVKNDRENFQDARDIEKQKAIKELEDWRKNMMNKGEKSEIYQILNGTRKFNEY